MSTQQLALLIPIISVTLGLTVAVVYIIGRYRRDALELEHRHRERMAAIDKGLDLPVEPVKLAEVPPRRPRYLLRGLVWLAVGLAIVFGAREALTSQAASFGWIPVAVGAAYLIFYFLEGRRESSSQKSAPLADSSSGRDV
jgi:hypothetical protein